MTDEKKKSWFARHKVMTVILAFIVIGVIASAAGGGSKNGSSGGGNSKAAKTYKFDERADKQVKDVEVLPDETATLNGVNMTLTNVQYKTTLSQFEVSEDGKTYITAEVTIENKSNETHPYNSFDFRIQTAGGQVLDGSFGSVANPLNSGDVVAGGKVTGTIVFKVPVEDGHQYVIWKPSAISSDRAIVRVK